MSDGLAKAAKRGSLAHAQAALAAPGQDVNGPDKDGCTALHHAVWRNHLPLVKLLLDAGAATDTPDAESEWTALHRALYFGHLRAAALLLQRGVLATASALDSKGRTALDLLSQDLAAYARPNHGEVFAWGHGANYQLGSGSDNFQNTPVRLEDLHAQRVIAMAASKFHSAALTEAGVLYTWGFGRGGRLGHPDFDIHSGKSAVIVPRAVEMFSKVPVKAVAVGKHHTVAVVGTGELYSWGSNRDGRLGYTAVDSQATPRRVGGMKGVPVACVAAANRHTVCVTVDGRVFSWGSNLQGQLGYGTSDSASNATPRVVEVLKGKEIKAVAAAKRHTLVLTSAGEVLTWGHRVVTPRRVQLAGVRDVARAASSMQASDANGGTASGVWEVVFHRDKQHVARPVAVAIAAGAAHSSVVTESGTVLAWRSMDPNLQAREVGGPLAGKVATSIAAGKYRTAVVTSEGDVYMWEGWSKAAEVPSSAERAASLASTKPRPGKSSPAAKLVRDGSSTNLGSINIADKLTKRPGKAALAEQSISPVRVEGIKQVSVVAVGEKHSLALQCWRHAPPIPLLGPPIPPLSQPPTPSAELASPRLSEASMFDRPDHEWIAAADGLSDMGDSGYSVPLCFSAEQIQRAKAQPDSGGVPGLQRLCEATVAQHLVEPRTVLQLLEFAEAAGAQALFHHCLEVAVGNLDVVLMEAHGVLETLPQSTLQTLEQALQQHCGPRPSVSAPPPGEVTRLTQVSPTIGLRSCSHAAASSLSGPRLSAENSFSERQEPPEAALITRQVRTLRKKLQQIDVLMQRVADNSGMSLDPQQQAKVATRPLLQTALDASLSGAPVQEVQDLMDAALAPAPEPIQATKSLPSDHTTPSRSASARKPKPGSSSKPSHIPADDALHAQAEAQREPAALDPWDDSVISQAGASSASGGAVLEQKQDSAMQPSPQPSWANMAGPWRSPEPPASSIPSGRENIVTPSSSGKKQQRKGGLSLFLAGELERPPHPVSPTPPLAPTPPPPPPAWKSSIPTASLKHIQSLEAATKSREALQSTSAGAEDHRNASVPLSQYMKRSAPIPMAAQPRVAEEAAPEAAAKPAWGSTAVGGSPPGITLKDIQAQQEQHRDSLSRSWGAAGASPGSKPSFLASKSPPWRSQAAAGAGGASPGASFPLGTSPGAASRRTTGFSPAAQPQSKWYIQEQQAVAPLHFIQTEETNLRELEAAAAVINAQNEKQALDPLLEVDEAELPHGSSGKAGEKDKKKPRRRHKVSHAQDTLAEQAGSNAADASAGVDGATHAPAKRRHRSRGKPREGAGPLENVDDSAQAVPESARRHRTSHGRGKPHEPNHTPHEGMQASAGPHISSRSAAESAHRQRPSHGPRRQHPQGSTPCEAADPSAMPDNSAQTAPDSEKRRQPRRRGPRHPHGPAESSHGHDESSHRPVEPGGVPAPTHQERHGISGVRDDAQGHRGEQRTRAPRQGEGGRGTPSPRPLSEVSSEGMVTNGPRAASSVPLAEGPSQGGPSRQQPSSDGSHVSVGHANHAPRQLLHFAQL